MPSVYDSDAFWQRVKYAAACITVGRFHTRHFDTTAEMGDGDAVVVAVYRRSLKNPKLAKNIWRGFGRESVMEAVERLRDVPTRKLAEEARRQREETRRRARGEAEPEPPPASAEPEKAAAEEEPSPPADHPFPLLALLEARERAEGNPPAGG